MGLSCSDERSSNGDEKYESADGSSPTVAESDAFEVRPPQSASDLEPRMDRNTSMEEPSICACELCAINEHVNCEFYRDCDCSGLFGEDNVAALHHNHDALESRKGRRARIATDEGFSSICVEEEVHELKPPYIPDQKKQNQNVFIPPNLRSERAREGDWSRFNSRKEYDSSTTKGFLRENFFDLTVEISVGSSKKLKESDILFKSFEELDLPARLAANVAGAGYCEPTLIQKYAMRNIQWGNDVMACAPSGTGKIAAYLIPIINNLLRDENFPGSGGAAPCMPRALILVPTHHLAIQVLNEASKLSTGTLCKCEALYGGASYKLQKDRVMKGDISILIGTPDRVKQFIKGGVISLLQAAYLVMDDANRLVESAHDDLQAILKKGKIPAKNKRQTLLFSTSFPSYLNERAMQLLRDDRLMIDIRKIGKRVEQEFVRVSRSAKKDALLEMMGVDGRKCEQSRQLDIFHFKTLIFVSTKKMADMLGESLSYHGVPAAIFDAECGRAHLKSALADFRQGRSPILIATALVERGISISGVDHVINYDMPKEIDDYVFRIGRTGAVGKVGHSTSFIDPQEDFEIIDTLIHLLTQSGNIPPNWLLDCWDSFSDEDF